MVQTYQSPVRVYKLPFELLMKAYEKRFPTSPFIPIFLECDVIKESQTEDGANHIVERRCKLAIDVPWMLKKLVGIDHAFFIQKNALDSKNRRLVIEAKNESFTSRVSIKETCVYRAHPDNPEWTCFEQEASLVVESFFGFESTVEKIAVRTYSSEIARAKETLMIFLKQLEDEGITSVEKWKPGEKAPLWGGPEAQVDPSDWPKEEADEAEEGKSKEEEVAAVSSSTVSATPPSKDGAESAQTAAATKKVDGKLEQDYIDRCLGSLTDSQASALVQLKDHLQRRHQGKMPIDSHILRFLLARDFNVDKAEEMICKTLLWRKEFDVDSLMSSYVAPELVVNHMPGVWYRHDTKGRPVFYFRLGCSDVKGVMKALGGEEPMLRHTAWLIEEGMRWCLEATSTLGAPVTTVTCVLDLEGLSMRHLWRPGIKTLIKLIEMMEANYPETLGSLILVRAPRIFPPLWTLIYPCLDVNTREKCVIYDETQDSVDALVHKGQHLDDKGFVPEFLGGTGKVEIPVGGLIPKDVVLHMQQQLQQQQVADGDLIGGGDEENAFYPATGFNSIYDRVTLLKGFPHEVAHEVVDAGNTTGSGEKNGVVKSGVSNAVLTWDFDVIKGEVGFAVYFSPKMKSRGINGVTKGEDSKGDEDLQGCGSIIGSYGELMLEGVGSPGESSRQIMSKVRGVVGGDDGASGGYGALEWKRIDETVRIYRERDSVQGSLEVSEAGCYVIQWQNCEKQKTPVGPFEFPALAAAPKAKVMTFTELIPPSKEIEGSISNLSFDQGVVDVKL